MTDSKMNHYLRLYRKQGKSDAWIKSWKTGWHAVGRKLKGKQT